MKAITNITILVLILFSLGKLNAQVPGYQGKRFMAGYGLYLTPNYKKIFSADDQYNDGFINLRHSFNAEYIVGRKTVLGLDLEFPKINYYYTKEVYDSINNIYGGFEKITTKISGISYGIHLTTYGIFSHNPVAPVGDYLRFKIFKINYSTGIPNEDEINTDKLPVIKSYSTAAIGLGYGQTRVFYNKAVLDIGVEGSWIVKNSAYIPNSDANELSLSENESLKVLFWDYFVNFKIGVSGLFF